MKILFACLLLAISTNVTAQTLADLDTLFNNKFFAAVTAMAPKLEDRDDPTTAYAYHMAGMSYMELGKSDSVIYCEQQAIDHDHEKTWISGWGYANMGKAYVSIGNKPQAIKALQKALDLHLTENSVKDAQHTINYILYSGTNKKPALPPKWKMIEGKHIRYYFQDTAAITPHDQKTYIGEHEAAYEMLDKVFKAKLPTKMIFYVWKDRVLAIKVLGHDLGSTNPKTCVTNTAIDQTVGHEMTHTFAYWAWGGKPPTNTTRFINEGIAVAFDLSARDKDEVAKAAVAGSNIHSILDLWNNEKASEKLVYPVGGAFVYYLYKNSTPDQFKSIVKDQTIENATKVYGEAGFNKKVAEFNKLIGLQ